MNGIINSCKTESTKLESTITAVLNPKKTNLIVRRIYRHLHMDLGELNDYYLNNLLDKLSKENKTVFLLTDFNTDLMKYDQHPSTNELGSYLILYNQPG